MERSGGMPMADWSPVASWQDADDESSALLRRVLDGIDYAIFMVDELARALFTNESARLRLRSGHPFVLVDGALRGCDPESQGVLARLLRRGRKGERSLEKVRCAGSSTYVAGTPMPASSAGGRILLTMGRPAACDDIALGGFAAVVGLTAAEQRVLREILDGTPTAQIAGKLGIKESTLRTHIRNILSKTGEHGMRDLVLQLAMLPPIRPMKSSALDWSEPAFRRGFEPRLAAGPLPLTGQPITGRS